MVLRVIFFSCNKSVEDVPNISVAQWEEVTWRKAQLEEEQKAAAAADEHRKQFLGDEMNDALELAEKLQGEDGCFGEYVEYAVFSSINRLDIGVKVWIDQQKTNKVSSIKDKHRLNSFYMSVFWQYSFM